MTVEPGNTYKYFIQVRLENPNYKKQSRVAYPGLAEVKELLSDWTETPSRAVDSEFRFYVVDQYLLDKASPKNPTVLHPFTKDTSLLNANGPNRGQMVALQLHNWAESGKGEVKEGNIGAWAVAERVVVKKGQEIGKPNLSVPMPRWDDASDSFLLPEPKKGKDGKAILKSVDWAKIVKVVQFEGSEVNMQPPGPSLPLVVDVKGGQSENWQKIDIADRAAVEVLILSPDGKLVSYNSREDSDPDTPRGKERLEHYSLWKDSIQPHDPKTDTKGPGDKKIGS